MAISNRKSKIRNTCTHCVRAVQCLKSLGVIGLLLVVLAGCGSAPIDTGNPVNFKHQIGVFELKVPKSWKQTQDHVSTEAIAAFSDPTNRAEIMGYAGLLDHRLADDEGLQIASDLIGTLLNRPSDLQITDKQHRSDGAFVVNVTFTRNNEKRTGQGVFRDGDLALSGTIVDGPTEGWADLQKALQPYADSFKVNPEVVQGTYFDALLGVAYAVVMPVEWPRQGTEKGMQVHAQAGKTTLYTIEQPISTTLDTAGLTNQAVTSLRQTYKINAEVGSSAPLPDGRTQVTLKQADRSIIGYLEAKDGYFIGLFFDVPAAQAAAYQPFIDFVYSTFVTGKAQ